MNKNRKYIERCMITTKKNNQNNIKVNKIILFLIFFNIYAFSYSQGGWDLGYIPLDSINKSWISKEVRIDFKSTRNDNVKGLVKTFDIRKLLSNKDTVTLNIGSKFVKFIEDWKIRVDQGLLKDQYLKSVEEKECLIDKIIIEEINNSTIVVKLNFYNLNKCNYDCVQNVTIDKSLIKGFLYKKEFG